MYRLHSVSPPVNWVGVWLSWAFGVSKKNIAKMKRDIFYSSHFIDP